MRLIDADALIERLKFKRRVPFPVSWTVKMKKKQKETQDILSYHSQAAGCSDKARALSLIHILRSRIMDRNSGVPTR